MAKKGHVLSFALNWSCLLNPIPEFSSIMFMMLRVPGCSEWRRCVVRVPGETHLHEPGSLSNCAVRQSTSVSPVHVITAKYYKCSCIVGSSGVWGHAGGGGGGTGKRRGLLAVLCLCLFAALKGLFTPGESRTKAKKILKKMEIKPNNKHHRKFSFSLLFGENGP